MMLAGEAALRAGAGRLQVVTTESVAKPMAVNIPEALVLEAPEGPSGDITSDLMPHSGSVLANMAPTAMASASARTMRSVLPIQVPNQPSWVVWVLVASMLLSLVHAGFKRQTSELSGTDGSRRAPGAVGRRTQPIGSSPLSSEDSAA
jgi:hypothetical protein